MKIAPTATPKINCKTPGCTDASPHTNMGTFVIPAKFMTAVPGMTRATMKNVRIKIHSVGTMIKPESPANP